MKSIIIYPIAVFLTFAFFACQNEEENIKISILPAEDLQFTEEEEFSFSTFSSKPNELEKCYCLLAEDEELFFQKKYIFSNDNNEYKEEGDNFAFLGHNNQWIRFKWTHTNKLQRNDVSMRYVGGEFELVVLIKPFERMDNSHWAVRGQMSLRTPFKKIINKNLYGECLCEQ
jgi:hypothetical protein